MTVLVLSLSVPVVSGTAQTSELMIYLVSLLPNVAGYVVSFVVIGVYWVGHHALFHFVKRTNRLLLWLNMFFLLCVGFIPFSTALIGRYPFQQIPVMIYGGNLIAAGLTLYTTSWYCMSNRRMVDKTLSQDVVNLGARRILAGPLVYTVAVLLSFVDTRISLALYAITPIYYVLPGKIDIHLSH